MNNRQLSKTIAHALRHAPQQYGLTLDHEGWTSLEDLLDVLRQRQPWQQLTEADIHTLLAQSEKKRYEINAGRIRAFYGHSLEQKIERMPATPPPILYHGTTPSVIPTILRDGLKPMNRQYVHLSTDKNTAYQVGSRRVPNPAILQIKAQQAYNAGIAFYASHDTVWLADEIPSTYILVLT